MSLAAAEEKPAARLDVNAATVEQLENLPGMNRQRAETIVRIRERNGPYRRVEEIRQLPGITKRQYERLLEILTVAEPEPSKPHRAK
jgi:competence protein ComEA